MWRLGWAHLATSTAVMLTGGAYMLGIAGNAVFVLLILLASGSILGLRALVYKTEYQKTEAKTTAYVRNPFTRALLVIRNYLF